MDLHKITTDAHLRAQRLAAVREIPSALELSLVLDRISNGFRGAGLRRESDLGARLARAARTLEATLLLLFSGYLAEARVLCGHVEELSGAEGQIIVPDDERRAAAAVAADVVRMFSGFVKSLAAEGKIPMPAEVERILAAVGK